MSRTRACACGLRTNAAASASWPEVVEVAALAGDQPGSSGAGSARRTAVVGPTAVIPFGGTQLGRAQDATLTMFW